MSSAVLPSFQPPQLKPITTVATAPTAAPCRSRVSDSPLRIAGISMRYPFVRIIPDRWLRTPIWVPADKLDWRAGRFELAFRSSSLCALPRQESMQDHIGVPSAPQNGHGSGEENPERSR